MTTDEIIGMLKANIDKTVEVVYANGDKESLFIRSVDSEGFTCDVPPANEQAFWVRFEDVADIRAIEPNTSRVTP